MYKNARYLYNALSLEYVFCILLTTLAACQSDEEWHAASGNTNKQCFQLLYADSFQTRAGIPTTHEISYFVADESGRILHHILSDYHPEDQTIVMEPLPNGNYQLLVLTFDKRLRDYGFTVSAGQQTVNDTWFSFSDNPFPVIPGLFAFYGKIDFTVKNQSTVTIPITLRNVFAAVRMEVKNLNSYIKSGMKSFTLSTQQKVGVYTQFTLSGEYAGNADWECNRLPIEEETVWVTMPQIDPEPANVAMRLTTLDHKQRTYQQELIASCTLHPNELSTVSVDLGKHPDARMGMIYASRSSYDSQARPLILQDDEPKSIFYDTSQRSFNINELLQVKLSAKGVLSTRFYSPCSIKGVGIWTQAPGTQEQIQLAYYDSIPAFCDATFDLQIAQSGSVFPSKSGGEILLTPSQLSQLAAGKLTIESNDLFWLKVKKIAAHYKIGFHSFGGDPDLPDGGIIGVWKGLRPVHIREAIALHINMAYMFSMPQFVEWQKGFQGRLFGNGGPPNDILDVSTIIPLIYSRTEFKVGLVIGKITVGQGGGDGRRNWGVHQLTFISHYDNQTAVNTAFHELGHCLGFNHSSSMTYGAWAGECCQVFYVTHIKELPVNDYRILNSRNNPKLYPY